MLPKPLRRDSAHLENNKGSVLKKSMVGTRFEALSRTRHNFSLVSNTAKNNPNSRSILIVEKPNAKIEYKLPKEPESNKNRVSDKASLILDQQIQEEEDEYPEV